MGSLVFDKCYPSTGAAADAFFLSKGPVLSSGSVAWFEKVGGVWLIKRQLISDDTGVTNLPSSLASIPSFPECVVMQSFTDGVQVGWAIAIVMLAAYGMVMVRRLIK
jgi:hypothetical protein